jgi:O-succinylbenzoic acid--CoA ligase
MQSLIALDLEPSQKFVDELSRAWDSGDAVLPIDQRLPQEAKSQLIEQMKPSHIISVEGQQRLPSGVSVESGDALVVATSGSTGVPKGVVLTHEQVLQRSTSRSMIIGIPVFL